MENKFILDGECSIENFWESFDKKNYVGYTKEELTAWKVKAFDQIHFQISETDLALTENLNFENNNFNFENLYYVIKNIIDEFEDTYMQAELKYRQNKNEKKELSDDIISDKKIEYLAKEYYKKIGFDRSDWLNKNQQNAFFNFVEEKTKIKAHHFAWILIKRNYNFDYMMKNN